MTKQNEEGRGSKMSKWNQRRMYEYNVRVMQGESRNERKIDREEVK